ncbi:hypothetical protein Tco_0645805 [Tanacetum coccineum]
MDWLSKRKFVIVCHEKVVRIPLEGDEILQVHGERTQGVVKTLMNTKFRIDLVHGATPVAKSPYRLVPSEMQELSSSRREVARQGKEKLLYAKVTSVRTVRNWEIVKTLYFALLEESISYSGAAEREDGFLDLEE